MEFKFKNNSTGCLGYDTMTLSIVEVPEIKFTYIPDVCNYWDTVNLDDYVNLNSGIWSVIEKNNQREKTKGEYSTYVIDNNRFDPSIVGSNIFTTFRFRYDHIASGCPY